MTRPARILDTYCGGGGCGRGYTQAGFQAIGVDIDLQPHYPYAFVMGNALMTLEHLVAGGGLLVNMWGGQRMFWLEDFDAIHASPPCQFATAMSNRWRGKGGKTDDAVNLIPETRRLLQATGLPYVIENVGAARSHLIDPVTLNGGMFVYRTPQEFHILSVFVLMI